MNGRIPLFFFIHGPHYEEAVKAYDSGHRFPEDELVPLPVTYSCIRVSHFPSLSCCQLESQHKQTESAFQPPEAPTDPTALGKYGS